MSVKRVSIALALEVLDDMQEDRTWYNTFHEYQYPDIRKELTVVKEALLDYANAVEEDAGEE